MGHNDDNFSGLPMRILSYCVVEVLRTLWPLTYLTEFFELHNYDPFCSMDDILAPISCFWQIKTRIKKSSCWIEQHSNGSDHKFAIWHNILQNFV